METELEKLGKIKDKSQLIGEFIEWLRENNYHICEFKKFDDFDEEQLVFTNLSIEEILAKYFNIDLKKAEEERQKILQELRENNKSQEAGLKKL